MIYRYPVEKLHAGSNLGNLFTFVQLDAESNIHGIWSSVDNRFYLGRLSTQFSSDSRAPKPVETIFAECEQSTHFEGSGVRFAKKIWLPYSSLSNSSVKELQSIFIEIEINNLSDSQKTIGISAEFNFPPVASSLFTKKPPLEETKRKFKIDHTAGSIYAKDAGSQKTTRVLFSDDGEVSVVDDKSVRAEFKFLLSRNETRKFNIGVALDPAGKREINAKNFFGQSASLKESTASALHDMLSRSEFLTPSGTINRGIYWAKVNTLRVQHKFRSGFAFTNDPPQDIVVVRDLAWYAMGCDFLSPEFSGRLIEFGEQFCFHPEGKLTEYIHADEDKPVLHDYDLNINDDTPLFILALEHHAEVSGDANFRLKAVGLAAHAADYIISQLNDGLVYCDAHGVNVWGIASWRNIIDDYNLTGFVTEINAECCAALRSAARLAKSVGSSSLSERYQSEAKKLESNILKKLRKDGSSLFYLNIDQEGKLHDDLTGDLVFPAMFEIGNETSNRSVVERLFQADLWTDYGARTVAKSDPSYNPESGMNLMGGVWPNLTAWFAMAARPFYPERVAEAMERIYKISEPESPVKFGNVIPGEFPERLHGDNFKSMGMGMSPWMPPSFLWLGIEGLLGLEIVDGEVTIDPALPDGWKFLCVFDLPVIGRRLDAIYFDGMIFTNLEVRSRLPVRVGSIKHFEDSAGVRVFQFADKLGKKIFAFSSTGFEGNISIPVNAHLKGVDLELRQNEMKEISVSEE
ncbi:MAG TPA: hypothetical protein VIS48_05130 [Candidatus Kryptonia bacterium]